MATRVARSAVICPKAQPPSTSAETSVSRTSSGLACGMTSPARTART
jgi:hypothetical protein